MTRSPGLELSFYHQTPGLELRGGQYERRHFAEAMAGLVKEPSLNAQCVQVALLALQDHLRPTARGIWTTSTTAAARACRPVSRTQVTQTSRRARGLDPASHAWL